MRASGSGGSGATAAVLWLMILLVFLPIALAHAVARYAHEEPVKQHAAGSG